MTPISLIETLNHKLESLTLHNLDQVKSEVYSYFLKAGVPRDPIFRGRIQTLALKILEKTPFDFLPTELLVMIFSNLRTTDSKVTRVNSLFRRIFLLTFINYNPPSLSKLFEAIVSMNASHLLQRYRHLNMPATCEQKASLSPLKTAIRLKTLSTADLVSIIRNPAFETIRYKEEVINFFSRLSYSKNDLDPLAATLGLRVCVSKGYYPLLPLMIAFGAKADLTDEEKCNPLHVAAFYNVALPEEFFTAKALKQRNNSGNTPLHTAVKHMSCTFIESAIKSRVADLSVKSDEGKTVLEAAEKSLTLSALLKG